MTTAQMTTVQNTAHASMGTCPMRGRDLVTELADGLGLDVAEVRRVWEATS